MCVSPKAYVERFLGSYERLFGTKPRRTYQSPLEQNDHPEIDTSEELGARGYPEISVTDRWFPVGHISLGRMDLATATMTMSSFRAAPRVGHLDQVETNVWIPCRSSPME